MANFVAASWQRIVLTLASLGRGLVRSASDTSKIEVQLGTDPSNPLAFDAAGGLIATASGVASLALPSVAASDNGDVLTVVNAAWAKAPPVSYALLGTTVFTTTATGVNLQSTLGALSYANKIKGFSIQLVGGGASGRSGGTSGGNFGGQGGMPGSVEDTPVYPVALLASLMSIDITVGAGGAGYSTSGNYSNNNAGTASSIALHTSGTVLLTAPGGFANNFGTAGSWWYAFCSGAGVPRSVSMRYLPSMSMPDANANTVNTGATTAGYGPGAGGTAAYGTSSYGQGGTGRGESEVSGTTTFASVYTAPATGAGAAGVAAATDRTFGSGGNGGATSGTLTGGAGGFPGGGGGGAYGNNASGAGAAGMARIHWWG